MANTLFDALFAPHHGSADPFLLMPDGAVITYDAFLHRVGQYAAVLAQLEPGERVAAQIAKTPDALAIYAACVQRGLVFLPMNPAYTTEEVRYFLADSGAQLFVGDRVPGYEVMDMTPWFETGATLAQLADVATPSAEVVTREPDDLAALLYTSGTTGRSKGAMLSHRNLLSNAEVLRDAWAFTGDDVLLHALPIFHTHGLFVGTNITLLAGGAMVYLPGFDLDAMIAGLPNATTLMGVPTFYTRLLGDDRFNRDLVAHMRLFVSGSAPLLAETHDQFAARTGHRILERYGMTETNMNTSNPYQGERRAGTVGHPLPGVDLRIMRDGTQVQRGEIGTIEVRGPNVFRGYWQMPEKTAEELRPDGWFITGDLGQMDTDGYVTIVGRGKDMIISGGYNVYPKEVELVLDAQPGVVESAVIGVPDDDLGEAVLAVLVASGDLDTAAVQAGAANALARYKQPRRYEVIEALPRNAMGKVQKNVLRKTYG